MNNQSVTVIWDKLEVLFESLPNEWLYQGDVATLNWVITRQYDGSTVTNFMINLTKDGILWKEGLTTNSTTDDEEGVVSHTCNCSYVVDNTYVLTTWTSNPITVSWEKVGEPFPEPIVPTQMVYIDPMSLPLLVAVLTWVVVMVSIALIPRR